MSLPEVLMVLREESKREASRALLELDSQTLAAFAVWDKESGRRLVRLRKLIIHRTCSMEQENKKELQEVYASWGIHKCVIGK